MTTRNLCATVKRGALPKCWVKEGEKYILMAKGGRPIRQTLPHIGIIYEQVLKDLDIPYEVAKLPHSKRPGLYYTVCAFWNPDIYEVKNIVLPVYQQVQSKKDTFVNTGKKHKGAIFTSEMMNKAIKTLKEVVMPAVEFQKAFPQVAREYRIAHRRNSYAPTKVDEDFLKNALDGKSAKVVKIVNAEIDNELKSSDIKIIPAYNSDGTRNGFYGIFDMEKLKYVPVIKLVVPGKVAGKIYGVEKQNQQYWEYCCGKGIEIFSTKE